MADIRINALANTASSSASDDFLALDGTTNGTRKLNAYSPSFGGNATVGGNLTVSGTASVFADALAVKATGTTADINFKNSSGTTIQSVKYNDSDGSLTIGGSASVDVPIYFNSKSGVERMRMTSGGNLGLGVTPSAWGSDWSILQTKGGSVGSNGADSFYIQNNAYYDGSNWKYVASSSATRYAALGSYHAWYNAPTGTAGNTITFTEGMRLSSTGLGVGTDPRFKLEVNDNTGGDGEVLHLGWANNADKETLIGFTYRGAGGESPAQIGYKVDSDSWVGNTKGALVFKTRSVTTNTAPSERMRVTSGGNLLLGTPTDGGQKLQVAGTADFTGAIAIGNTVNTVSPTSPNRTITMVIGGTTYYIAAKTTND